MENSSFIPYVYKVINKITKQTYIGAKFSKGKKEKYAEIGIDYFTSSANKAFRKDFREHTENYEYFKIFECESREEVGIFENIFIKLEDPKYTLNIARWENNHIHYTKMSEDALKRRSAKNNGNKGFRWWHDINGNSLHAKEPLEGFTLGRSSKHIKSTTLGKHWFNNGIETIYCEICPEGFSPGILDAKNRIGLKDKHWYTNGEDNICAENCPQGYYPGKTFFKENTGSKGMHWWNNGKENIFAKEYPPGFSRGRLNL